MVTGAVRALDSCKAVYSRLQWTKEGDAFAVLRGVEDEAYEDRLYSLLGYHDLSAPQPTAVHYDPTEDESFPADMTISPHRDPSWSEKRNGIFFGIHELKKKEKRKEERQKTAENGRPRRREFAPLEEGEGSEDKEPERADVVVWHYLDKRLPSQQQVEIPRDKNFSYLSVYWIGEKKWVRLADEEVKRVETADSERWAVGLDDSSYRLEANLDGRRFRDIYVVDLRSGERTLAQKKCRWFFGSSPDGERFLFYRDGKYFTYEMGSREVYDISKDVETSFVNEEDDHNVSKPPIPPLGWVKGGGAVLLYDNWDLWKLPAQGGRATNLTVNGKAEGIRYGRRFQLDPDEKGIDLAGDLYLAPYGEWTKKSGIGRIAGGRPGVTMLCWGDAGFNGLTQARDAEVFLYTRETCAEFPDFYAVGRGFEEPRKLTEANPQQKDFLWCSGSRLIGYESAKGDRLQAALFLPASFEEGKSYPTVVLIYERLSRSLHRYTLPGWRGFNMSLYTSQGYAVLTPDIHYELNDPGMSALWCVKPAVEAAIATDVVDREQIAIHGHSWGGYQTAFLITQTDLFKAAVAGAPLTNLISMYSSIYWNTGFANQPIFESSQGRFTGGYWENIEAYVRNSPVYFADRVRTPLLLLHNDKDGAVDWNQGIEYFNTLRRLGKPVVMLQYKGENHGLRKAPNRRDYTERMLEFFDHYLKGKPAPDWLAKGIPVLELQEHLKTRSRRVEEAKREQGS